MGWGGAHMHVLYFYAMDGNSPKSLMIKVLGLFHPLN